MYISFRENRKHNFDDRTSFTQCVSPSMQIIQCDLLMFVCQYFLLFLIVCECVCCVCVRYLVVVLYFIIWILLFFYFHVNFSTYSRRNLHKFSMRWFTVKSHIILMPFKSNGLLIEFYSCFFASLRRFFFRTLYTFLLKLWWITSAQTKMRKSSKH